MKRFLLAALLLAAGLVGAERVGTLDACGPVVPTLASYVGLLSEHGAVLPGRAGLPGGLDAGRSGGAIAGGEAVSRKATMRRGGETAPEK